MSFNEIIKQHHNRMSPVAAKAMELMKSVDSYFFCEEDAEIKPYFYGSIAFGALVTLITLLAAN